MASKILPQEIIEQKILMIRGQKVMLDRELAYLYQVKPIVLRQQVKRNKERFPADFMFKLTKEETRDLVSQNVIPSKQSLGGYLPYVFTEQGVAMLSGVLHSYRAAQVNIAIMRAFVKLRRILSTHKELAHKLDELERKIEKQSMRSLRRSASSWRLRKNQKARSASAPTPLKRREVIFCLISLLDDFLTL